MAMITFMRRKGLGAGSIRGMISWLDSVPVRSVGVIFRSGEEVSVVRNDGLSRARESDLVSRSDLMIRWGVTSPCGLPIEKQVNPSEAIKQVNDKLQSRVTLSEQDLSPSTMTSTQTHGFLATPLVLRPRHHAQGRNLFVCNGVEEVLNVVRQRPRVFRDGWYASELINKVAEYRVYVVSGRVATVARKTPADASAVAWNVAQGGRFDVVRWGDWPLEVCRVALEAAKLFPLLDFGGVDVMVDEDGRAWVIEINSAPSLPLLSDGSVSYRQVCMAKCFKWMMEHGKERMEAEGYDSWRQMIHPAIREYE